MNEKLSQPVSFAAMLAIRGSQTEAEAIRALDWIIDAVLHENQEPKAEREVPERDDIVFTINPPKVKYIVEYQSNGAWYRPNTRGVVADYHDKNEARVAAFDYTNTHFVPTRVRRVEV